ncbi:hypothetical protein BDK63_003641 [Halomonas campaniensis]|uniref:Uncharacterized protein n=1 Tax=Halomonas campaniensis TaxID=213554 RepID=A0A7W5PCE0_9GAMM|nr:hypothetical protein [Halomonas campaniensis]MBB3332738.1 hypothetical protein [Halomonas campaniensis]
MKSNSRARTVAPKPERARYVAWLLRLDPSKVYRIAPDATAAGNQHLVDCVFDQLQRLVEEAARFKSKPGPKPPRFLWYLRTLEHCCAVMSGTTEPLPPNEHGEFENKDGYRCGTYRPEGGDV